jgi:hypothetical protein
MKILLLAFSLSIVSAQNPAVPRMPSVLQGKDVESPWTPVYSHPLLKRCVDAILCGNDHFKSSG